MPAPAMFDSRHIQTTLDAELTAQATARPDDVWKQLRDSFVMADCDADPSVTQWARRYTRNAPHFESRLRLALPQLIYIQQVAAEHDVPGEFVLLPWVESHFQATPEKRRGSVGIWQIMPKTARAMGLRMDAHYDGRLDLQASSNAVMKLLTAYHGRFQDWHMAGYAFNAGEFATARFIKSQRTPTTRTPIPEWAGHDVTEQHLSQLLAIACVVRDPSRFGVSLPTLPRNQQLTTVRVAGKIALTVAARRADMSVVALKQLNAAFLNDMVDGSSGADLLMPAAHATRFLAANVNQIGTTATDDDMSSAQTSAPTAARQQEVRVMGTHRIHAGESLWQIAQRFAVTVRQLRRWNHLDGDALHPGEMLQVSAPMNAADNASGP